MAMLRGPLQNIPRNSLKGPLNGIYGLMNPNEKYVFKTMLFIGISKTFFKHVLRLFFPFFSKVAKWSLEESTAPLKAHMGVSFVFGIQGTQAGLHKGILRGILTES